MKHHKKNRTLGLKRDQRIALLRSLAVSLIRDSRIKTTEPKAKELRPFIERLITKSKNNTLASKRFVLSKLGSKIQTSKLFKEIAPKYEKVSGGYTRIIKLPIRKSDGSKMALIELV